MRANLPVKCYNGADTDVRFLGDWVMMSGTFAGIAAIYSSLWIAAIYRRLWNHKMDEMLRFGDAISNITPLNRIIF